LREGIREMVCVNLLPSTVWALVFTQHGFPTISSVELLRAETNFWSLGVEKMRHLHSDTSHTTAVEKEDRHFPAVQAKRKTCRRSSMEAFAAIFDESMAVAASLRGENRGCASRPPLVTKPVGPPLALGPRCPAVHRHTPNHSRPGCVHEVDLPPPPTATRSYPFSTSSELP
jgi:hypothetical protein